MEVLLEIAHRVIKERYNEDNVMDKVTHVFLLGWMTVIVLRRWLVEPL